MLCFVETCIKCFEFILIINKEVAPLLDKSLDIMAYSFVELIS